jgi:8-oxo-dGTP pyrophosphatase MutT (NUDIX family)
LKPRPEEKARVAAAICYRLQDSGVEFLLVETKRGKRWTFPKGHVEPGERPWEAAAREAREEAGVEGDVSSTPLTEYRYPDTRGGDGDSLVTAYLLNVVSEHEPARKERHRKRKWVAPDEAVRLLAAGGREREYAEEHARVVREATATLSQPV